MKKLSVIMPTYNGEKYLREQLDSIVNQTYPVYELIIADDCSADSTVSIIEEYAARYSFIKYTTNKENRGINNNFFSALEMAGGDFIAVSDQDDIWEPEKLEMQMEAIGNRLLCSCFSKPFSDNGLPVWFDGRIPNYHLLRLIYVSPLPGHTILFSKELLSYLPQDIEEIKKIRFYDVILEMVAAAQDSIAFVDKVLVNHRRLASSASFYVPKNYSLAPANVLNNIRSTYRLYKKLKPQIAGRHAVMCRFLQSLPVRNKAVDEAIEMTRLQSQMSLLSFVQLVLFCLRKRYKIFHTYAGGSKSGFVLILRALYFPVSCSEYYHYLIKQQA